MEECLGFYFPQHLSPYRYLILVMYSYLAIILTFHT